ncbi:MAG: indole-3-glycerol phosphate synthase TrpC [Campylobacter sp.]
MTLDEILRKTKEDLKEQVAKYPLEWLGRSLAYNPFVPRDVWGVLKSTPDEPFKIIAEIKKINLKGEIIRQNFEPIYMAKELELGGANAICVLTQPHFFEGEIEYVSQIRRYTQIPLLRKDFIVDKYQIIQALVYGADFVSLIAKILSTGELKKMVEYAHHLGLEVVVEVRDKEDITKAIFAGANIISINHRNLQDFTLDMDLCERLITLIPKNKIIIAQGGISQHSQLVWLSQIGVDAFLIGEHFMRQENLQNALKTIKEG